MPRHAAYARSDIEDRIRRRERVVTHAELMELGMPRSVICRRIGPGGPWQWALPGVVICHRGTPTHREKILATLRYAGDGAVITGATALRQHGARESGDWRIHVLIPHGRQRTSHHFVVVERTRFLPAEPIVERGIPLAPVARATIDAARRLRDPTRVTAIVAEVVQRRMCTPGALATAVDSAATQRSGLARAALAQVDAGIRSAAEAEGRTALRRRRVREPEWNVELFTEGGEFIASPDGWWDDEGVALQIDSMQWHLSPEAYKRTQRIQRRLLSYGVPVLPWAPGDIMRDPEEFARSVTEFLELHRGRARPAVVVRRSRSG